VAYVDEVDNFYHLNEVYDINKNIYQILI